MSTRVFRKLSALGASGVDANILAGTDFEYPTGMSKVVVAVAAVNTLATCTVKFGSRIIAEDLAIAVEQTVGGGPRIPDNVVVSAVVMPTERIQIAITNDAAGTADPTTYVEVTPL